MFEPRVISDYIGGARGIRAFRGWMLKALSPRGDPWPVRPVSPLFPTPLGAWGQNF